eukprot:3571878-Rhodomonas_salina.1
MPSSSSIPGTITPGCATSLYSGPNSIPVPLYHPATTGIRACQYWSFSSTVPSSCHPVATGLCAFQYCIAARVAASLVASYQPVSTAIYDKYLPQYWILALAAASHVASFACVVLTGVSATENCVHVLYL